MSNLHKINKLIEPYVGYINPPIILFNNKMKIVPENCITSTDSFIYSSKYNDILDIKVQEINEYLRHNNNICKKLNIIIKKISNSIKKSPILNYDFFVYRGINTYLHVNIGDIIENKGFLYTSLHKTYAKEFMNNTTKCYEKGDLSFKKMILKKHGEGTICKIYVPPGSHYIEKNINFNYTHTLPRSELIFDKGCKLNVISVSNNPDYQTLELIMLF